ncbi:MAG: hypothetical protein P1V81_15790 [Planctomycetota bacterium]|nr:hypothetical protein [Planctomycetota bacterium]
MPQLRAARRAVSGFTMLHLILLLVGLSGLAMVGIPMFFERASVTLENGAVLMARDLRTAQNRAAYSHEVLFLRFFEDGDGYEVVTRTGEPIDDPRTGRPFVRRYSIDAVFEGLRITELQAGQDDTIVLSPIGETSDILEARLEFEGEVRLIYAERGTGMITIEGSTSGFVDDGI